MPSKAVITRQSVTCVTHITISRSENQRFSFGLERLVYRDSRKTFWNASVSSWSWQFEKNGMFRFHLSLHVDRLRPRSFTWRKGVQRMYIILKLQDGRISCWPSKPFFVKQAATATVSLLMHGCVKELRADTVVEAAYRFVVKYVSVAPRNLEKWASCVMRSRTGWCDGLNGQLTSNDLAATGSCLLIGHTCVTWHLILNCHLTVVRVSVINVTHVTVNCHLTKHIITYIKHLFRLSTSFSSYNADATHAYEQKNVYLVTLPFALSWLCNSVGYEHVK